MVISTAAPSHLAPVSILDVWQGFSGFPMETLTKAWVVARGGGRQRSVEEMEVHRAQTGASGNCFDLAFWLQSRLLAAGVGARIVSDDITRKDAHVAVVAEVKQGRFLCDLGDMWTQPVFIDRALPEPCGGFFPAACISHNLTHELLRVDYHRPGGKVSHQTYDLRPLNAGEIRDAAEQNQRYLAQALVEVRGCGGDSHWEYDGQASRWSTPTGLVLEPSLPDRTSWSRRIGERSGMVPGYVEACLTAFERFR